MGITRYPSLYFVITSIIVYIFYSQDYNTYLVEPKNTEIMKGCVSAVVGSDDLSFILESSSRS